MGQNYLLKKKGYLHRTGPVIWTKKPCGTTNRTGNSSSITTTSAPSSTTATSTCSTNTSRTSCPTPVTDTTECKVHIGTTASKRKNDKTSCIIWNIFKVEKLSNSARMSCSPISYHRPCIGTHPVSILLP